MAVALLMPPNPQDSANLVLHLNDHGFRVSRTDIQRGIELALVVSRLVSPGYTICARVIPIFLFSWPEYKIAQTLQGVRHACLPELSEYILLYFRERIESLPHHITRVFPVLPGFSGASIFPQDCSHCNSMFLYAYSHTLSHFDPKSARVFSLKRS